jgi:hypothetical protein
MANHAHKQIRDAVVTALTGLATTGSRVYANRVYPIADLSGPSLIVRLDNETVTDRTIHSPQEQLRELTLSVEAVVKSATFDDTVDQVSKEVEIALSGGVMIAARVYEVFYSGMTMSDEAGDKPIGIKQMRFTVPFAAASNAPDVLI